MKLFCFAVSLIYKLQFNLWEKCIHQKGKNPAQRGQGRTRPTLRGKVIGNYRCQERESQFSLWVCDSRWSPSQQYMGSMDWTCWVKNKGGKEVGGPGRRVGLEGIGKG